MPHHPLYIKVQFPRVGEADGPGWVQEMAQGVCIDFIVDSHRCSHKSAQIVLDNRCCSIGVFQNNVSHCRVLYNVSKSSECFGRSPQGRAVGTQSVGPESVGPQSLGPGK